MSLSRMFSQLSIAAILLAALVVTSAVPALASQQIGDRLCTGSDLVVAPGETAGSILAFGCNVTIEQSATVENITAFGANINANGIVNGDITDFGGNINVGATGVVNGDINPIGGNVSTQPGSTVRGTVGRNMPARMFLPPMGLGVMVNRAFGLGFNWLGGLATAIAFAALGALVVVFAPGATRRVSEAVQQKPLNTAGVGCLTLFLLPILALLLVITVVGLPVVLVLALIAVLAWMFGSVGVGFLAGEKILQAFRAREILPVLAVIVGILVLAIVGQVPVIGWLISCLVGLLGIGAVVLTRFGTRSYPPAPTFMLAPAPPVQGESPVRLP